MRVSRVTRRCGVECCQAVGAELQGKAMTLGGAEMEVKQGVVEEEGSGSGWLGRNEGRGRWPGL